MAPRRRSAARGRAGARYSKNTVGRTRSTKDEAGQQYKPTDIFDFSDNSDISSLGRMSENENDEVSYETFEPPLHSTAIYTDEVELFKNSTFNPSTPQGKEVKRSSNTSEIEESENESVKITAKKVRRKLKPISDDSDSTKESNIIIKGKPVEKISRQQHEAVPATASSEHSETSAELGTPKKMGPLSAKLSVEKEKISRRQHEAVPATASSEHSETSDELGTPKKMGPLSAKLSVEKETLATESQLNTQKKMFRGKRKKSRSKAIDSGISDYVHIWCLKEKKSSDIVELDLVLSAFEKTLPEYKQNIESKICKEAINKFHSTMKEELIKMLKEIQMLKTLKRKNAKIISDIEKKRKRLIEVQDELLRLEPQLKQLQVKYDELKERKSSFKNAEYFLSNLKQLHQDYSDICERERNIKETYDSSSLPALLFRVRTLLGAEKHLQNINHELEKLLDQK